MSTRAAVPADGVAWVTGASSGIGRMVALRLARDGFVVAASARGEGDLAALVAEAAGAGGRIEAFPLDVTDPAATAATVAAIEARLGPIALAILNAGVYRPVDGADLDLDACLATVRVNLDGTIGCLVPVIAAMRARRAGQIAVVSSVAGYRGLPTSAAYGGSKAALFNLAESLRFDLEPIGIRIQVVAPGFVDTPATRRNPFPMPFLMPVAAAADRLVDGLRGSAFEITFPRRFTWGLKLLRILPYRLYFPLVRRATGWRR